MGAILGGTMRSPLTGAVFALELTHDYGALLPVLVASTAAHAFTVLVLKRSILTEKVARRGFHITREYAIDPLEVLFVRDVMDASVPEGKHPTARADEPLQVVLERMASTNVTRFAVIDEDDAVRGVVTLEHMLAGQRRHVEEETRRERLLPLDGFLPPILRPSWQRITSLSRRG
jgi:CBS-domain-containing membrane protein